MSTEPIRFGILGTAKIASNRLIPAIREARNATVLGVASRNADRAKEFAKLHKIERSYSNYLDLLRDPEIDAVYIPLPNGLHYQWVLAAAECGKHILCEKPAALNEREARAMIEACKKHNVTFMEAFVYQFHPQWKRVSELLRSGIIGTLNQINAEFSFHLEREDDPRWDSKMGGGALYDVGCYCVHIIRRFSNCNSIVNVHAKATCRDGNVDESLTGTLEFENGVVGNFTCSFVSSVRKFVEFIGSTGTLQVLQPFRPDFNPPTLLIENQQGKYSETLPHVDIYKLQVEHFADCIRSGATPDNTAEDTIANARILDALYEGIGRDTDKGLP